MSVTYDIGWQGCLYDNEKQREFLSELNQIAQLYNEIYFAEDKDETTLCFFDNTTLNGNILISTSLLYDIPDNCPDNLILPLKKYPDDKYFFICNEVKLFGLQFKVIGDPCYTRYDKDDLETVSYVFWGFNSTDENKPYVKSNLARVVKSNNSVSDKYDYKLVSPGVSFRALKPWYVILIYEYVNYYYIKNLVIENCMLWDNSTRSDFTRHLKENDPNGIKDEIKEEALTIILEEIEFQAQKARELDEIEIIHTNSASSSSEE